MTIGAACRKSDLCTGHECYPPRKNDEGSEDVFVNSRPSHRFGDKWLTHSCSTKGKDGKKIKLLVGSNLPHAGILVQGSKTVFINSKAAGKTGNKISCGSVIMTGSTNVFIGDGGEDKTYKCKICKIESEETK